jgi:hypothetical protein
MRIPRGFIVNDLGELEQLISGDPANVDTLRLIHQAKKRGGRISDVGRAGVCDEGASFLSDIQFGYHAALCLLSVCNGESKNFSTKQKKPCEKWLGRV